MLEDGVHAVSGLLPRHPQVLLQRSGDAAMRMITMIIMIIHNDDDDVTWGRWTGQPRRSPVGWWGLEYKINVVYFVLKR